MIKKTKKFLSEVKVELSKVSWSTRQELIGATGAVMTITLIMAIYIGVVDLCLSKMFTYFIK